MSWTMRWILLAVCFSPLCLFLAMAWYITHEPNPEELTWVIPERNASKADQDQIAEAVRILMGVCPDLFKLGDQIVEARARVGEDFGYRKEDYGWNRTVTLNPRLGERLNLPRKWNANGHTLYYDIGVDGTPGVIMSKDVSMLVCGFPGQSADLFVPIPIPE